MDDFSGALGASRPDVVVTPQAKRRGPATLRHAFTALECTLAEGELADIRQLKQAELIWCCMNLSGFIREHWINGAGSPLADKLSAMGGWSNQESLSTVLVELFWRYLNGEDLSGQYLEKVLRQHGLFRADSVRAPEKILDLMG